MPQPQCHVPIQRIELARRPVLAGTVARVRAAVIRPFMPYDPDSVRLVDE